MRALALSRACVVLAAVGAFSAAPAASKKDFEESTSADGLGKVIVKGIDLVYARPGLTLAPYTEVMIATVQVAFRKDVDPQTAGSRAKLAAAELEKIRSDVCGIVRDEFAKELAKGPYVSVSAAVPDVLQVRAQIADLYVNAPDTMEPGRSRTYTTSAGEMTLVMELADSGTGATLGCVYDRREARRAGGITWTNSVTNQAEAEGAANAWARISRSRLDAARGIGNR